MFTWMGTVIYCAKLVLAAKIPTDLRMFLPIKNGYPYLPLNANIVSDLNTIYSELEAGLTLLYCTLDTLNMPANMNGVCINIQRKIGTNVSTTQYVAQVFIYRGSICYRTSMGNGTQLNWTEWKTL